MQVFQEIDGEWLFPRYHESKWTKSFSKPAMAAPTTNREEFSARSPKIEPFLQTRVRPSVRVADHQTRSPPSSDTIVLADLEPLGFPKYEIRELDFDFDRERSSAVDDARPYPKVPSSRDLWGSLYLAQSAEESSREIPRLYHSLAGQTNRLGVGFESHPMWLHPHR